jgi:cell division septation protein DedD
MESNLSSVKKIPIEAENNTDNLEVDNTEKVVADVYANLKNNPTKVEPKTIITPEEQSIPEIGVIEKVHEKDQKNVADLFGDNNIVATPAAVLDSNKNNNIDPWKNENVNNLAEPKILAEQEQVQVKAIDAAISKSTATIIPEKTPTKVVTVAPTFTATPVKTNTPVKTPEFPKSNAKSGWYAQVAAPTSKAEADSFASKLKENGFRVYVEKAQVNNENYYRILVGPEESRSQGEALVKQLNREAYIKGTPFLKMIK